MSDSPLETFVQALDSVDVGAALAQFAPQASFSTAFGAEATGLEEIRSVLGEFVAGLRATQHELTSVWNPEPDVWIAEMSATYELKDFSQRGPYRRVFILLFGSDGIQALRIYGAHELSLEESGRPYTGVRGAHGWLPTL